MKNENHNYSFDFAYLKKAFLKCNIEFNEANKFCTMKYFRSICNIPDKLGRNKAPKLRELIEFLEIKEEDIVKECKNFYKNSGGYHDARFDTTSLYLAVKEGINRGYIKGKEKEFFKEVI